MIAFLDALPIGDAVRVILAPPAGTERVRVLRKTSGVFTGESDPDAGVAYEGVERYFIDAKSLTNGTPYYYCAFYLKAAVWTASPVKSATPAATANLIGPDLVELVRARLEAALKADVDAGRLFHDDNYIPCLKANPTADERFPIVSVHLDLDRPAVRGLGEMVGVDVYDEEAGEWTSSEGWLSSVKINVITWVVNNADVRAAMRLAVKKAMIGNLPVFSDAGMSEIEITQSDVEDFESFSAPIFQTYTSLTCLAPSVVDALSPAIADVTVDARAA